MRIILSTPTGKIGNKIARQLLQEGEHDLVLLTRDPSKLEEEKAMGATVVKADLTIGNSLIGHLVDADVFFFLIPPGNKVGREREIFKQVATTVAQAIDQANLSRIVFMSSLGAHQHEGTGMILGLRDAEKILQKVTTDIAILRPGYLMENCFWVIDSILNEGIIKQPISGHAKMSFIATKDIAAKAVKLLTDTTWNGIHIKEILGPIMTFDEVAATIGEVCGRDVRHVKLTPEETMSYMTSDVVGFNADFVQEYIEVFEGMEKGLCFPEFPESAENVHLTSLADFTRTELTPLFEKSALG